MTTEADAIASLLAETLLKLADVPHDASISFKFTNEPDSPVGHQRYLIMRVRLSERSWAFYLNLGEHVRRDRDALGYQIEKMAFDARAAIDEMLKA